LALKVDEPWRDDVVVGVDAQFGRSVVQQAGLRDGNDSCAANTDVAIRPGIASAVDDTAVLDHDVVARLVGRRCVWCRA
jgi:hypothetical protein